MNKERIELANFLNELSDTQIQYVLRLVKKLFGSG